MATEGSALSVKKLLLCAAVLVALLAVVSLPQQLQGNRLQGELQLPSPDCDLSRQSCSAEADGRRISLSIDSSPVHAAVPLQFSARLDNVPAEQVMLDLQGRDMYMGINQVHLKPVAGQPGLWQGSAELAVCTTGEMVWQATLVAAGNGGQVSSQFEFKAK
ncbi:hypothetical protein [Marinobacterium arenosum]|uniref:hypothetical protein n=1 Tax=Marinobacterium arenosum TaxID=2862496 RepID=UPI001C94D27D|nr:hypothetical protein [Marinobacterium arenosum]MBY4677676.1 hypothetical protein [Marinobacterium arenosum]